MSNQTLWYTRCPVPSPLSIAAQLGWIDQEFGRDGVEVKSIVDSNDQSVRESHFDHRLSWSFRQGGNVPPIWTRSKGRETKVIALSWIDEFQAIVTLPNSGIRSAKDLAGRRFGLPTRPNDLIDFNRATSLSGLDAALSLGGLTRDAVEIVELRNEQSVIVLNEDRTVAGGRRKGPYAEEVFALIEGRVDAIFVKAAGGIAIANLLGAHIVADLGFHPDPNIRINSGTPRPLTVDAQLANERPDLVEKLVRIITRAAEWASTHPDETRAFVGREVRASEEHVRAAFGPDLHLKLGVDLAPASVAALTRYKDFLFNNGFLAADFDVGSWIDGAPLAASRSANAA